MGNYKESIGHLIYVLLCDFSRSKSDITSDHTPKETTDHWLNEVSKIEESIETEKKKSFFKGFIIASILTSVFFFIIMYF